MYVIIIKVLAFGLFVELVKTELCFVFFVRLIVVSTSSKFFTMLHCW